MGRRLKTESTVYAWTDPRTGFPRYVGICDDPRKRWYGRFTTTKNVCLLHWINELKSQKLKPGIIILQRDAPPSAERRWILRLNRRGYALLNREKTAPLHLTEQGYVVRSERRVLSAVAP